MKKNDLDFAIVLIGALLITSVVLFIGELVYQPWMYYRGLVAEQRQLGIDTISNDLQWMIENHQFNEGQRLNSCWWRPKDQPCLRVSIKKGKGRVYLNLGAILRLNPGCEDCDRHIRILVNDLGNAVTPPENDIIIDWKDEYYQGHADLWRSSPAWKASLEASRQFVEIVAGIDVAEAYAAELARRNALVVEDFTFVREVANQPMAGDYGSMAGLYQALFVLVEPDPRLHTYPTANSVRGIDPAPSPETIYARNRPSDHTGPGPASRIGAWWLAFR